MAKVAKKGASSAKKGATTKKVVAKKADKQKKAPAKAAPTASKKKAVVKPVAKKAAPAKKVVSKKVVAKKVTKPAAKKAVAKPVAKKVAVKAKAPVAKKANVAEKPVNKKVTAPVAKKVVAVAKGKAAPVAKKVVEKIAPQKVEAPKTVAAKAKNTEVKAPVVAPPVSTPASATGKPRRKKKNNDDDDDDEEVVVFRKPAKPTKSAAAKKMSSKYVSEELTMEGPAPKRVGQITMTSDEKIKLKKALLNKCIDIQKNTVSIAKKAMEDALTSANAEKVTEELSDSFRESMHATRDMYARQANEGVNNLGLLNRINIIEHDKVKFGSVVFTNFQNYFISTGLGEIKIDDLSFQAVSTLAPLFQILVDKRKGDTFMFLDRLYTVIEVF